MIQKPVCLTIAGSDPSGGAGIQGDLKTFASHGVYGMAVISALTAQNTMTVSGVAEVGAAFVTEQLERIYEDIPTDFVKTGMLFDASIVEAVSDFFSSRPSVKIVVDPVMISSSGGELLKRDAVTSYVERLFPLAALVTPNNLETEFLTGVKVNSVETAVEATVKLHGLGVKNVLVKGGDTVFLEGEDRLYDVLSLEGNVHVFERELVGTRNSHGTGCALASAICCELALGRDLAQAVLRAGEYVGHALRHAYQTGKGSGAINHLWNFEVR